MAKPDPDEPATVGKAQPVDHLDRVEMPGPGEDAAFGKPFADDIGAQSSRVKANVGTRPSIDGGP